MQPQEDEEQNLEVSEGDKPASKAYRIDHVHEYAIDYIHEYAICTSGVL